jgi:hypothetical protein
MSQPVEQNPFADLVPSGGEVNPFADLAPGDAGLSASALAPGG